MHEPSLIALEYPKILERLARHTSFSAGREKVLALHPSADPEEVRRRQAATSEAVRLLRAGSSLGVGGARDVRPLVERTERQGALEAHQFLDILSTLQAAGHLQRTLQRLDETFPMLRSLIPDLYPLPALQQAIARCIGPQGEVLDGASPRLGAIRAEIRTLQNRLQERMQVLLQRYRAILQEPIITQRQGRYVLAVRADSKRRLRGLVHDHSASGATLYIEPLEVVEMGNELRELQLAEEEEVRRILMELSEQVAGAGEAIRRTVETLAQMDLVLALALFGLEQEATEPALVVHREGRYVLLPPTESAPGEWPAASPLSPGEPPLFLKRARHPLLNPTTVVPIDVYVGGTFRVLVITGPNTGGKTVALKTVGLLNLMAQAGMHLPVEKGSRIPLMDQVFADIGDEQSIEQNLSTFSAHMTRIIEVLQKAGADSLVLLDELGAGTDPVEGSALARALIEALLERGCLTLVTTHHSELKAYAYATPGVENACVEFDVETLSPTYVLTIGLPGRSNAMAIAGRLGLAPAIIERARRWLRPEDLQAESLLQEIQRQRDEMQAALEEAAAAREHARNLEKRLEREIHDLERRRHEILAQARAEAEKALEEMHARVEALQREIARAGLTREELAQVRRRLEEAEKALPEVPPPPPEEVVREEIGTQPLQPGDAVWVESLGTSAEVLSPPDGEGQVELLVGHFKMRRPLGDLRRTGWPEVLARSAVHLPGPPRSVPLELEIRGWRVTEAEQALDRYLNDAYLAGLPFVRIIHGKGTGTLRRAVREILASHPLVASFEGAPERDGGEGVTIARLIAR